MIGSKNKQQGNHRLKSQCICRWLVDTVSSYRNNWFMSSCRLRAYFDLSPPLTPWCSLGPQKYCTQNLYSPGLGLLKQMCSTGSKDMFIPTFMSMSSSPPHFVHFLFMQQISVPHGQITCRSRSLGSHHLSEKFSFPMFALCLPSLSWSYCSIMIWLFFDPLLDIFLDPLRTTGATTAGMGTAGTAGNAGNAGLETLLAFLVLFGAGFLAILFSFLAARAGWALRILSRRSALLTQSLPSSIVFSMDDDRVSLGFLLAF